MLWRCLRELEECVAAGEWSDEVCRRLYLGLMHLRQAASMCGEEKFRDHRQRVGPTGEVLRAAGFVGGPGATVGEPGGEARVRPVGKGSRPPTAHPDLLRVWEEFVDGLFRVGCPAVMVTEAKALLERTAAALGTSEHLRRDRDAWKERALRAEMTLEKVRCFLDKT